MKKINNKGIGMVVGIILMVAMVVAISATIYTYVKDLTVEYEKTYINVSGNVTGIKKVYFENSFSYYIFFDFNDTAYHIIFGKDFNWKLGNYYNMTLYTYKNADGWYIYKYSVTEGKIDGL